MFPNTQLKWTLFACALFLVSCESHGCGIGFERRNSICVDADECVTFPGVCGANAQCFNTHGSYYCICNEGFLSTPANFTAAATMGQCEDINECFMKTHECPADMECVNNVGSYKCLCPNGHRPTRTDTGCEDIDECKYPDVCGTNAFCNNLSGSYSCQCHQGYSNHGNNQSWCTEIVHFCLANE